MGGELFHIPESVINTLIGVAGGILVAYLTARVKNSKPKNGYVDTAFSALEGVAKRTEEDNARLRTENTRLVAENISKDVKISEVEIELERLKGGSQ